MISHSGIEFRTFSLALKRLTSRPFSRHWTVVMSNINQPTRLHKTTFHCLQWPTTSHLMIKVYYCGLFILLLWSHKLLIDWIWTDKVVSFVNYVKRDVKCVNQIIIFVNIPDFNLPCFCYVIIVWWISWDKPRTTFNFSFVVKQNEGFLSWFMQKLQYKWKCFFQCSNRLKKAVFWLSYSGKSTSLKIFNAYFILFKLYIIINESLRFCFKLVCFPVVNSNKLLY